MNTILDMFLGFAAGFGFALGLYDREIAAGKAVVTAAKHLQAEGHEAFERATVVLSSAISKVRARL
jgi:hypothetical protein